LFRNFILHIYDWVTTLFFNPRLGLIYYPPGGGRPRIPCFLKDPESPYKGKDWQEVEEYIRRGKLRKAQHLPEKLQAESELDEVLDRIEARAKKRNRMATQGAPKLSKSARLKAISAHRSAEMEAMQRAEADELRAAAGLPAPAGEPTGDESGEVTVPIPQPNNIRDIRRRMMRNEQG
jgi:hypothetical protein